MTDQNNNNTVAIAIIVSIGGILSILLGYRLYCKLFLRKNKVLPPVESRQAAFSVGGNLVRELTTPITDTYSVTKSLLGRGSSAEVIIGTHLKNKRRYAIKIIDTSRKEIVWRYDREKTFLKDIDHTNVVRLYEVYSTYSDVFCDGIVYRWSCVTNIAGLLVKYNDGDIVMMTASSSARSARVAFRHPESSSYRYRCNVLLNATVMEAVASLKILSKAVYHS